MMDAPPITAAPKRIDYVSSIVGTRAAHAAGYRENLNIMNSEKLRVAFSDLMPDGVCIAAGPLINAQLSARERASLGAADVNRLREFASGRAYAKQALSMLGICHVDLPIGPNRTPVWPPGVVGSITHVLHNHHGTYVAAAVARATSVLAVGIDLEMEDGFHPRLWPYALTERELERILACPIETRRTEAQFIWCAKEATAKITGDPFDPSTIEIERNPVTGDFAANFVNARSCLPGDICGRTARFDGFLLATAVVA